MNYPPLNFPTIDVKVKSEGDEEYIFDIIRKKFILLTREEWVRQHFIHLLIHHLGYPAGLFQVERGHSYSGKAKRTDILVYHNSGSPHLLVECKAPDVSINKAVLNQISAYNKTLQAKYIAISNGLSHFVWEFKNDEYIQLKDFPVYTT